MKRIWKGAGCLTILLGVVCGGWMAWRYMTPEWEMGSWASVEEVHQRMRSVASPGPLEDKAPEVLRRLPIQEVLGWRNMDPLPQRGYFLVVRMELDFEKLMNIAEVVGRRSDAATLPIGLESLAVEENAKEEYLTAGLSGGEVEVSVQELKGGDRWLIWVNPR